MNKDLLFVSSGAQSVASGGTIALPTILRRKGCAIESIGSGAVLKKAGYYEISGTVTFTTPVAGTVSLQAQKGGADIQGISSSVTTTGTSDVHTLAYSGVIRVYCCEYNTAITLVNEGVAVSVSSATMKIEYYA